jgi:putative membrane protein
MRLAAVQTIKAQADAAILETKPAKARELVKGLTTLLAAKPETAKGRATLKAAEGDIIDAPHLVALAERELLGPLDRQARALIVNSSKRVSIVTAVSPRAIVDLLYVLYEASRLIRAMAELYGGRPGTLGMIRLMRDVLAHLAVTGSIAVGDGLVQQVLGHGLASKLSARLGEGVINGLMTARIGIAAMDLCRPLAFRALRRPGIGDFIGDLAPSMAPRTTNPQN